MSIASHRIGELPSIFLIEDFISPFEEEQLLTNILSSKSKWKTVSNRRLQYYGGTVGKNGILFKAPVPQWMSSLMEKISKRTMVFSDKTKTEDQSVRNSELFANHVLVNEYSPGDGIMAHTDGPCYFPAVAILSLGWPIVMRFLPRQTIEDEEEVGRHESDVKRSSDRVSVLLNPRSLLVFKDAAYSEWLHGIDAVQEDELDASLINPEAKAKCRHLLVEKDEGSERKLFLKRDGIRISLTVRRVERVHSGLRII